MADYDDDDELFKDLYGDDEPAAHPIPAQPVSAPKIESQPDLLPSEPQQKAPENAPVERATDPRKQPSGSSTAIKDDDNDQDKALIHDGGGQAFHELSSRDETMLKDTRLNPNKHEDGKMFIGGLNWETTDESLRAYFEQFGEITECTVMRENQTGRSRGFGFLTFKDPKCVNVVMVKEHILDGKIIDPKRAIPREEQDRTSKIFVGGIGQDVIEEEFKEYFEQFGTVLDATLMMDKETGRPRGFGFVTFDDDSAVENCMAHGPLAIKGKMIEVKRAQPKGREREQGMDRRPFERERGYGNVGSFPQNGFNAPQGVMNPYGGMTPALMAQWYQRMQAYYTTMGRGMMPGMGMGAPMMGMPNMNMQGMGMGGIPNMGGQMMGIGQGMNQGMGGYQPGMPMNQGYGSPNQQQLQQYQQESSSHEGEYTYDTSSDQVPPAQHSPPSNNGGEIPSGPREGPPPNAPTGPSGLKPNYVGGPRGRGMMRGVGRGYGGGGGGSFPGGMARGGNVRYNPYAR